MEKVDFPSFLATLQYLDFSKKRFQYLKGVASIRCGKKIGILINLRWKGVKSVASIETHGSLYEDGSVISHLGPSLFNPLPKLIVRKKLMKKQMMCFSAMTSSDRLSRSTKSRGNFIHG